MSNKTATSGDFRSTTMQLVWESVKGLSGEDLAEALSGVFVEFGDVEVSQLNGETVVQALAGGRVEFGYIQAINGIQDGGAFMLVYLSNKWVIMPHNTPAYIF